MACDCIAAMNAKMAPHNTRLIGTMCWPREKTRDGSSVMGQPYDTVTLQCEKVEPRKRDKVSALPTFCPFCGTRYLADTPAEESAR